MEAEKQEKNEEKKLGSKEVTESKQNFVQVSMRIDASLHERVTDRVHMLKKTDKSASIGAEVNKALRLYLDGVDGVGVSEPPVRQRLATPLPNVNMEGQELPPEAEPWVNKLIDILTGPSGAARTAIQTNLEVFSAYVKAVREASEDGIEPQDLSRRIKEGLAMADREVAKAAGVVYGKKKPAKGARGDQPATGSDRA